ncbi:MAG: hypothetical protein V7709_09980 [Halioglobus sp.]
MIEKLWGFILPGAALILLLGLLHHHWQIITAPVPLDLYEGTMPLITSLIAEGNNPYTKAFQPQAADVYPPLYNMLVAPLTSIFGNTFELHRSVSALFIFAAVVFCGLAGYRVSGSKRHGFAAATMFYAALLFYATPVSSTNAPGVAIYLAGLLVPWYFRFSNASLLFGLVCGILAFYTKQYFILGMAMLCLYTFVYVSMSRALLLGIFYACGLISSLAIVHISSPYYLDNTLFAPSAAMKGLQSWEILAIQLKVYLYTYSGLLLVILAAIVAGTMRLGSAGCMTHIRTNLQLAREGLKGPLLAAKGDFFWFCLLWSSIVIVFYLGRNPGNYMTYLFQLMSPFLLIIAFRSIASFPTKIGIIAPVALFSLYQAYAILPKDFSTNLDRWRQVEQLIQENDQILATQMLVMPLLKNNKDVHQDGHTFYFPLASNKPDFFVKEKKGDRVSAIWNNYITNMYRKIERREFDLILVSPWELRGIFERNPPPFKKITGRKFLSRHYKTEQTIKLSMTDRYGGGTYDIQVWRPKNTAIREKHNDK